METVKDESSLMEENGIWGDFWDKSGNNPNFTGLCGMGHLRQSKLMGS
jgi:hypothetical protein